MIYIYFCQLVQLNFQYDVFLAFVEDAQTYRKDLFRSPAVKPKANLLYSKPFLVHLQYTIS